MQTKHRRDAGFSLTALIFFAAAASIAIAAVVPAYQMQAKREVELELIFRGGEYTRALQKYHNKFGVWPTSIDQLVSTNNLKFIRRAYKDPLTGKDFRLLLLNPDGSITGSKVFKQNTTNNQSMFGNNTQQFGQGQNNQQQNTNTNQPNNGPGGPQNNTSGSNNNTSSFNSSFGNPQGQAQNGNNPSAGGLQSNSSSFNSSFGGQQNQPGQPNNAAGGGAFRAGGQTNGPTSNGVSNISGGGTQVAGSGIVGVASDVEKDSIIVYNTRQKYDEWEFIAILGQQGQQPNGQNPQQNQQQNQPQNGQPPNNPFGTPSTQPFGGAPTGGNGAAGANGNFGFGGNQQTPNPPGKLP
jgi:hypothetical protein